MLKSLSELFSYAFMTRALIVGILISLCSSLLGVSLVLKRYSMIGDGLSHIGFGALAIAASLGFAPLIVAVPAVIVAAFFLLRANENTKLHGDAAIAVISTVSLALGVFLVSKSGANVDLENYLFGSILSVSESDTVASVVLSAIVLALFFAFYQRIFAVTFDESFAKATGVKAELLNLLLAILTALTVVIGMRLMGTLLISSLIIFPPISAMRVCKTFKGVTLCSGMLSVVSFLIGMFLSFYGSAPTGSSIVLVSFSFLICFTLIGKFKNHSAKRSTKLL